MNQSDLLEVFRLGFMQRALIAGCLIAAACAVLGIFLVLRRLSLIGDGLAHVTFGSVAVALFLGVAPSCILLVAIPLVALSSIGILKLTEKARVYGDAAIGIVSATGISIGILLAAFSGGFNIDLFSYLFGNILAVTTGEVALAGALFVVIAASVALNYHDLFALTFDEEVARTAGVKAHLLNRLMAVLTALAAVLAMKVVGIMLVSALIIFPAVSALQVARSFIASIVLSVIFAVSSVMLGILLSYLLNLPAGGAIIGVNLVLFLVAASLRRLRG